MRTRPLRKRDLRKLIERGTLKSIDTDDADGRFYNLAKRYWVYGDLLDGLAANGWVRFAPGFKGALYGRDKSDWCIKILGMGVGQDPTYFRELGYYLEYERRMLETFGREGFRFQPEVMSQAETVKFLVKESGVTEEQAELRTYHNDVLVTQYIRGIPFATQTGHYVDQELNIVVMDKDVLREMRDSLLELQGELNRANRKGLLHNDAMPPNIIFTLGERGRIVAKLVDFELAQDLSTQSPDHVNSTVEDLYRERNVPVNQSTGKHMKNLDQHLMDADIRVLDTLIQRAGLDILIQQASSPYPDVNISIPLVGPIGLSINQNTVTYWVNRFRS
jgi:serine/threonine protein kinase